MVKDSVPLSSIFKEVAVPVVIEGNIVHSLDTVRAVNGQTAAERISNDIVSKIKIAPWN